MGVVESDGDGLEGNEKEKEVVVAGRRVEEKVEVAEVAGERVEEEKEERVEGLAGEGLKVIADVLVEEEEEEEVEEVELNGKVGRLYGAELGGGKVNL